ncbi:MAG: molybdenum cofactor cytidylyltransferase [Rhodobacteraceae bacterium HLUCCA12]|nr:MAG: molybdenum cofactor cytidylyltransferase [Rhodobacteraceae bacterium HLUCCA12]
MQFGPVPVTEAEGTVLAHSVPLTGGKRLRKGKRLDPGDQAALKAAGLDTVIVARLESEDIDEDSAALRLANALVPDPVRAGLRLQQVGTGRVNLLAEGPGVARISAEQVHAVNACNPAITLATVPEWTRMEAGGMVATVKIITYALPADALDSACAAANDALSLCAPVLGTADLIQTTVGGKLDSAKGQRAIAARLDRLGVTLGAPCVVAHEERALAEALAQAQGELLLILTGSATSDSRDVAPNALRRAGGVVDHFGMPVDPGNLLFVGQLHGRPVVGLPGCARSPALNGADWVMERLICGLDVGSAEIVRMGVGGLLKEMPSRPRPRSLNTTR